MSGKKKKALVYNTCGFFFPHAAIMAEEARTLQEDGYEVVLAYCKSSMDACFCNPEGRECICKYCHACNMVAYERFPVKPRVTYLPRIKPVGGVKVEFHDLTELKAFVYKNVNVGYGVVSTYVSLTRRSDFKFDKATAEHISRRVYAACSYVDGIEHILEEEQPDVVSLFNGRLMEQRAIFDLAKARGIHVRVNEVVSEKPGVDGYRRIVFVDCLPHNVEYNAELIERTWAQSNLCLERKEAIGAEFYERRAVGKKVNGSDIVYVSSQDPSMLPRGFNSDSRNIVIFNSSEDEFISIGKEFDQYSIFPSQLSGILEILDSLKDTEFKVFLRLHPNLAKVKTPEVMALLGLEKKYENLTVIPPDSKISTYALLKGAEKVVTFGSTVGIEAVYWRKPSILLGASLYRNIGCCYVPESSAQAITLIKSRLEPLPVVGALKFGFMLCCDYLTGESLKYFSYKLTSFRPRIVFNTYRTPDWLKVGGSAKMATILARVLVKFSRFLSRARVKYPVKLDWTFRTVVKR